MGFPVLIVFLLGFAAVVFYFSRISLKHTVTKYIFVGYLLILIAAFGFYEAAISKNLVEIDPNEIQQLDNKVNRFFMNLYEGKISEIDDEFIYEQKQIEFPYDKLMIVSKTAAEDIGVPIIVEKKDVDDNLIDMIHFRTKPEVDYLDSFEMDDLLKYEWKKNTLFFEIPDEIEFTLGSFKKEFPILQFTGEKDEESLELINLVRFNILYLRVPKDVEISHSDSIYVEIIGEEE